MSSINDFLDLDAFGDCWDGFLPLNGQAAATTASFPSTDPEEPTRDLGPRSPTGGAQGAITLSVSSSESSASTLSDFDSLFGASTPTLKITTTHQRPSTPDAASPSLSSSSGSDASLDDPQVATPPPESATIEDLPFLVEILAKAAPESSMIPNCTGVASSSSSLSSPTQQPVQYNVASQPSMQAMQYAAHQQAYLQHQVAAAPQAAATAPAGSAGAAYAGAQSYLSSVANWSPGKEAATPAHAGLAAFVPAPAHHSVGQHTVPVHQPVATYPTLYQQPQSLQHAPAYYAAAPYGSIPVQFPYPSFPGYPGYPAAQHPQPAYPHVVAQPAHAQISRGPTPSIAQHSPPLPSAEASTRKPVASKHKSGDTKRFDCPDCGKPFARAFNLQTHLATHRGFKPFDCPADGCGKSFSRRHDLGRHLQAVHESWLVGKAISAQEAAKTIKKRKLPHELQKLTSGRRGSKKAVTAAAAAEDGSGDDQEHEHEAGEAKSEETMATTIVAPNLSLYTMPLAGPSSGAPYG